MFQSFSSSALHTFITKQLKVPVSSTKKQFYLIFRSVFLNYIWLYFADCFKNGIRGVFAKNPQTFWELLFAWTTIRMLSFIYYVVKHRSDMMLLKIISLSVVEFSVERILHKLLLYSIAHVFQFERQKASDNNREKKREK